MKTECQRSVIKQVMEQTPARHLKQMRANRTIAHRLSENFEKVPEEKIEPQHRKLPSWPLEACLSNAKVSSTGKHKRPSCKSTEGGNRIKPVIQTKTQLI